MPSFKPSDCLERSDGLIKIIISLSLFVIGIPIAGAFAQTPASATWPLTNPASSGTGRTVNVSGNIVADSEYFKNMEINGYTGLNNSQRVRMAGTNNTWPASQTTQMDTVYTQFSVSAKAGSTFAIDSLTLFIGAASTNYMKANLYFSTDSAFVSRTSIPYTTGNSSNDLISGGLTYVGVSPNLTLNSGQTFYFRFYPWVDNQTSGLSGKYVCVQNVVVSGTSTGGGVSVATLTTTTASFISTTFATSGGNISADGGAPVTERGVCWDTTSSPTTATAKASSGSGIGSFTVTVVSLIPGKKYYLRAYAVNSAGIAYGRLDSLTTLAALAVPTVTTANATSILTATATVVGNVTAWGGDTVKSRGVCWNTTGTPTTTDNKTDNGLGIGSFTGTLTSLTPNTTYHVRAFAANSVGAGYGNEVVFTTQTPAPDVMKIVSKDGSGNYTTVQAAFDSVPDNYTGKYVIYIRKGTYKEKLLLGANKTNVILAGEDRDSTILTYDDYAGKPGLGTSTSYSVAIDASDFVAMNITFQNTVMNDGSVANQQAVALRVNGDRQAYYNCKLLGYQDTYYTWGGSNAGRTYHKNCTITGSVDFIFGRNIVVFDSCTIHENRNGGTLTAASTDATTKFGYVFLNSTITYDAIGFDGNPVTNFYLGRPWQASPRTVFIQCSEPSTLNAAGWLAWNVLPALYGEYKCSGAGYIPASRDATLSRAISDSEAATYTLANIFSKNSVSPSFGFDWVPTMPVVSVPTSVAIGSAIETPAQFTLSQNYPNPFNPTTAIEFTVRNNGRATLRVYNIVGQPVAELFNGEAEAGKLYLEKFDASRFASGIYFSVLQMGSRRLVHKMSLLK
jgi:pectinesterase